MYNFAKQVLKQIIPSRLIRQNEKALRNLVYQFYRGGGHKCNICGAQLRKFVGTNQVCPRCGSIHRGRRLYTLLVKELENRDAKSNILHLSPSASLRNKISSSYSQHSYHTSDYVGEFAADNNFDLRDTKLASSAYDIVICYHVLEHIVEDNLAMAELFRITKPGGVCFIQTPFYAVNGAAKEDYTIVSPAARLEHFGQEDHVRIYSVASLESRLIKVDFSIERQSFLIDTNDPNANGFKTEEYVILARK